MNGLRTQESDRFCTFFGKVQDEAKKQNKVFFLDTGEGKEISTNEFEGENLSGWLIPKQKANTFETTWRNYDNLDKWDEFYVYEIWQFNENKLKISFEKF